MNEVLRAAREKSGLTQVQVAECAHITETSYQRIEYNKQRPSLDTALLIAQAVNSTVEKLFGKSHKELFSPANDLDQTG